MEKQMTIEREGSKERSSVKGYAGSQELPLEVVVLLSVFARIELRRQEKRRTSRKEVL